jgi:hypothetical protein
VQLGVVKPGVLPYRPAAQSVHTPALPVEYLPTGQIAAVALVDPATQKYPAAHVPVHDEDDRPDTAPYRPAGHGPVHEDVFSLWLAPYRPALQLVHEPAPDRENVPGWQLTAVALVDPAGHAYPAAQLPLHVGKGMAADAPYSPAEQSVHTPLPDREYLPGGQADTVALEDPAGQAYPAEQGPEQEEVDRPVEAPKRPTGHGAVQEALVRPWVLPYKGMGHAAHAPVPPVEYCPTGQMAAVALTDPATQ